MQNKPSFIGIQLPGTPDVSNDQFGLNFIDLRCLPKHIKEIPKNMFLESALPTPRLELRWDKYSESLAVCDYNLVLPIDSKDARFSNRDLNVEGNKLSYNLDNDEFRDRQDGIDVTSFLGVCDNGDLEIISDPTMLANMQRDSFVLKIPAYIVYNKVAIFVEPDSEIKHPAPYPVLGIPKSPPQNIILDTSTDGPTRHFLEELNSAQMSKEFIDAFIMQLVNACMERDNGRANAGLIINKIDNTLSKVLNSRVVDDMCSDARNFVNGLLFKLEYLGIWLPPTYKAPYRFGGWIGNDIILQYDDTIMKLESK